MGAEEDTAKIIGQDPDYKRIWMLGSCGSLLPRIAAENPVSKCAKDFRAETYPDRQLPS